MRPAAYAAAVFVTSALALIMEIVAGRLIAPYVGMSLYTWTAIIAVVLAGLSVGHWLGGRLAGVDVDHRRGGGRAAAALALAAVTSLASLVLIRVLAGKLLTSGLGPVAAIAALSSSLFFLPSLFVGIVSPLLTKLAIDDRPEAAGRVIGRMFAAGAAGSIAGTLLAGYLFISWIGTTGTVIAVAAVYGALALAFAGLSRRAAAIAALLAVAGGGFAAWGERVQAFRSPCHVESDYFCIRIDDFSADSGRASTLMVLDHLVHSINDRDDPSLLYSPYVHFVDEMAGLRHDAEGPKAAFFIGGGGYTLPRAWAARRPDNTLIVAEIDPAVTRVAAEALWLDARAPGLDIRHRDARLALQALPRGPAFDVVFGDAFHDIAVPPHLVTREFNAEIAARLRPDGFYVVNIVDLGVDPRFLFSVVKTLGLDFPVVEVWKSADEIDVTGRVTFIVLAAREPTAVSRLRARRGMARAWVRWQPAQLARHVAKADVPVLTDDFTPVDRLMADLLLVY